MKSFLKNGFLMVPETISYKRDKDEKNSLPPESCITQSRFCLTQIDISELKAHEKHFGCFHLEFTNQKTYALGATPVFYLPGSDPNTTEWPLKTLAVGYLSRLFGVQSIIEYIRFFGKEIEDKKDQTVIPIDWKNNSIEVKKLRYVLAILTQKLRPEGAWEKSGNDIVPLTDDLLGALRGVSSLFYPTDKDIEGDFDELYYFRQREWRICAGVCIDGKPLYRKLFKKEKAALLAQDPGLFGRKMVYATGKTLTRLEGCYFMQYAVHEVKPEPGEKNEKSHIELIPVQRFVERIIVPKEALEQTKRIAKRYKFDRSQIVDFESAMKLEISESEYEAVKTQCRIQMLKAACMGC